jgi:hypothetical protein
MLTDTDLKGIRDSVKQWSQRRNIDDATLNDFIEIALSRANRMLRIPPLEGFSALPVDVNGFAELPANFVEAKELQYVSGGREYILDRKAISEVDYMSNATSGGPPQIFGRFGNYFRVAPWNLGDELFVNLYYYTALPSLVADTDTNWFTLQAPELLLYGALTELADYARDADSRQVWDGKFSQEVNTLQAVEDRAEWSGSTIGITPGGSTTKRFSA